MRILSAASECQPWIKTGGLADAVASLARALTSMGEEITVVVPGYRSLLSAHPHAMVVATQFVAGMKTSFRILSQHQPVVMVIDIPDCFDREGSAYANLDGEPWQDDARRFSAFSEAVARLAGGGVPGIPPFDLVHCHDWHTGLVPAWLYLQRVRVPTLFTVHNALYQGLFPQHTLSDLGLPAAWWTPDLLEFHGRLCFLKTGLVMADRITTVSPRHARELCEGWQGGGLEGVFRSRKQDFHGILNGIDYGAWNPHHDPFVSPGFDRDSVERKSEVRRRLRARIGLADSEALPLVAVVSRLAWQKGIDLLPPVIENPVSEGVQWVVVGTGDQAIHAGLTACERRYRHRMRFMPFFDEEMAHQVLAAADIFCMPSRYEPCGLTHLQAMRYGAVPVVTDVGGLADTVTDAADLTGNGVVFSLGAGAEGPGAIVAALQRMLSIREDRSRYAALLDSAMRARFDWHASARQYLELMASMTQTPMRQMEKKECTM